MQAFVAEFQFFIISIILLSNTNYLRFALTNIHRDAADHIKYIQRCVNFSLASMFISVFFVLKFLLHSTNFDKTPTFYATVLTACFTIIAITLIVALKYRPRLDYHCLISDWNLIPTLILLAASFLGLISSYQLTHLSFLWFAITVIQFFFIIFHKYKIKNNAGLYFILGSLLTLLPVNIFRLWLSQPLVVLVNLGINAFIMYGLFIFYSQFYVTELHKTYENVLQYASDLESLNRQVSEMAYVDAITGLPNEQALLKQLESTKDNWTLILINIRNFSGLSQMIGYDQGNMLLFHITEKLKKTLSKNHHLYKLHSDNFILCTAFLETDDTKALVEQLQNIFIRETFLDYKLEAYFGITALRQSESCAASANTVISAVKMASRRAKNSITSVFLTPEEYLKLQGDFDISYHLRKAIEEELLEIYYQPQVCARTKSVCSYEALIRWRHQGQYISPNYFIPLAESNGLISAISHHVIHHVFKQIYAKQWNGNKKVSINLSSHQMVEAGFIEFIHQLLDIYPIKPNLVVFEITETALLYDVEKVSETIAHLKAMGFEFSLDDFGHGYSSLYRFSKLNFDEVKFDKFFINDLEEDEKLRLTFLKTVELFKLLNMRIVIEGVETQKQEALLDALELDIYQGYYYAKPMPLADIMAAAAQ